jgi:formylmethanofuran dehydrogenase subunit E
MSNKTICGMTYEDYVIAMEEFHGGRSPGMLVGGLMIDLALRELGPTPYLNMVTETRLCVPDAVQITTPCTMGNGYLQVLDWGIFGVTAYDRMELIGVRVGLAYDCMKQYPLINSWFDRAARVGEMPAFNDLAVEVMAAGDTLLTSRKVTVKKALKESKRFTTGFCPDCGDSYPLNHGPKCPACQGQAYYVY